MLPYYYWLYWSQKRFGVITFIQNYYSFYLQKKWDKRVAVSSTHNITSNNKSILVLDDEFDIVTFIKLSLQKYGYSVSAFTDPFAALEYLNSSFRDCSIVISYKNARHEWL